MDEPAQPNVVSQADRLKLLMDYTKFHIGLYATIITILLALATIGVETKQVDEYFKIPVMITVVCILFAGFCGGVVAGNLPEQTSFDDYWKKPIGPLGLRKECCPPTKCWARLEHSVFWIGVANAVLAVVLGEKYPFASAKVVERACELPAIG